MSACHSPQLSPVTRRPIQTDVVITTDEQALMDGAKNTPPPPVDLPQSLPGYAFERELGRGGTGVVFLARQLSVNRPVAVKLVLAGQFAHADTRDRFRREAEVMAAVQHPSVGQVIDSGVHDNRPYLVMGFYPGGSLAQRAKAERLTPREAARLVARVAAGVAELHAKGILHRDLTPGNVLLAEPPPKPLAEATPKVVDFGLAKWADAGGATRTAVGAGTPGYMAPEQFRSIRDVTPAADVYSLGAILYELLTGRPPYEGDSLEQVAALIIAGDPVEPRALRRGVPGELNTICLKCLERDPRRRYPTAGALAADLDRFLTNRPIDARPAGPLTKSVKWVRRNRLASVVVAASLAVAVVGVTAAVVTHAALTKAQAERLRTRAALDQMTSQVTADWLKTQAKLVPEQKAFLQLALTYYQEFAREAATDEAGREQLAAAHRRVGNLLQPLGQWAETERAYRAAIAGYRSLVRDDPAAVGYRTNLAASLTDLGTLQVEITWQVPDAEAVLREALAVRSSLARDFPDAPGYSLAVAVSRNDLALWLRNAGRIAEAEAVCAAAEADLEALARDFPGRVDCRETLAATGNRRGILLCDMGRTAEAEPLARQSIAIYESLVRDFPADLERRLALSWSRVNLGRVLLELGRAAEAEAAHLTALAGAETLARDYAAVPRFRNFLAECHVELGLAYDELGRRAEADAAYHRGLAVREALARDFPDSVHGLVTLAAVQGLLGERLMQSGDPARAIDWYDRAIHVLRSHADDGRNGDGVRAGLVKGYRGRAVALNRLRRFAEALPDWDAALRLFDDSIRVDFGLRSVAVTPGAAKSRRHELRCGRALALARTGREADARRELGELAALDLPADALMSLARAAIILGSELAWPLLERATDSGREFWLDEPDLAPARVDPRFRELLWRVADRAIPHHPPAD